MAVTLDTVEIKAAIVEWLTTNHGEFITEEAPEIVFKVELVQGEQVITATVMETVPTDGPYR